eukprot:gene26909-4525_t
MSLNRINRGKTRDSESQTDISVGVGGTCNRDMLCNNSSGYANKYWGMGKDKFSMLRTFVRRQGLKVLIPFLIVSLWVAFTVRWAMHVNYEFYDATIMSNRPEQPLFVRMENFFSPSEFNLAKSTLAYGVLAQIENSLDENNFGNTSGVVMHFTRKGMPRLLRRKDLSFVHTFVERVMHPEANAFVVNILKAQSVQNLKSVAASAGWHLDNTLTVWQPNPFDQYSSPFVSHQTTVLYLSVPTDLEGGELVISPPEKVAGIPTGNRMWLDSQLEM